MRTISVTMSVTLDGVVQGLGRPDEDTRDGFTHGGWGPRYEDEVMGREMGRGMSQPTDMLFGRRTWQDFLGYWPRQSDNPFTDHLNRVTKYVASTTLDNADSWQNSVLLPGEAVRSVAELKAAPGPDLAIIGSGGARAQPARRGAHRQLHTAHPPPRAGWRTPYVRRDLTADRV